MRWTILKCCKSRYCSSIVRCSLGCKRKRNVFDSYRCSPPNSLSKFNIKRNDQFFSEYKLQGLTSKRFFCASYCFHLIDLTKVLRIDLISAVSNLYYQMIYYR